MSQLSPEAQTTLRDIAKRYGVSMEAVATLLNALKSGHGTRAQFSHPDLGGMGQWSAGGMIQIGDMFNTALKAKVDQICTELARGVVSAKTSRKEESEGRAAENTSRGRWPSGLGSPSAQGSQNDMHYAVFPETRRLAVEQNGTVTVYDTADHRLSGVSQRQGGEQKLQFASDAGDVDIRDLKIIQDPG